MMRQPGYRWIALLLLSVLAPNVQTPSPAEAQESKPINIFRVGVDLVQVDAVVTDSKGNPVTDLNADDFVLYQDGKIQDITTFSIIKEQGLPSPSRVVSSAPVEKQSDRISPPPPPVELKREQVRRSIALVVDDLGLSFEGIVSAREAIRKWVDTEMQPGDLVAVITTMSGMGALQQFTADKRMLYAAIDRIVYTTHSRVGVSSFTPAGYEGTNLSGIMKEDNDAALTVGTLESIRYVVNGLKSVPGRKSLILFSESLGMLSEGAEMARTGVLSSDRQQFVRSHMQSLVDDAHKAAVVIHSIDPRGVIYTGGTAEDSYADISADNPEDLAEAVQSEMRDVSAQRSLQLTTSLDGMVQLARETGGLVENSRNDIFNALQEVANDGSVYYLLGYTPDEKTVSNLKNKGRQFHSIKVRVKRPGMKVRSRSGFFLTPNPVDTPGTLRERMTDAMLSPFNSGTLPVRLTALFSQTSDRKLCINALLHFKTNQLHFTDEEGWKKADVRFMAATFDVKGEQVDLQDKTWTLMARGDTFREMNKHGVVYLMRIPVKKPGAYQVRVVLSDTGSEQLGSATHFIDVPDLGKGHLALSGIALAVETNKNDTLGDAEGFVADSEVNGTAAVRVFRPGDRIRWAYQVLNAKTAENDRTRLRAYVRLFRAGREVYSEAPRSISGYLQEDSRPSIIGGSMELNKISPGRYILQVVVQDMLADEKYQTAVQSINFEVVDLS